MLMANRILKILLITPPLGLAERYGDLAGAGSSAPSLGLLMVAAIARHEGFPCAVVDASALAMTLDELLGRLAGFRPDILGISATTLAIAGASRCAEEAKTLLPGLVVILGGPHVTAAPRETLTRYPDFDIAVIGEGEATFRELLLALDAGKSPAMVAGVMFREGDRLVATERRPFLTELDSLPLPAWDLLEGFPDRYPPAPFKVRQLPAAILVTSRGCPNTCIFCDRSVFGSSCHAYSAEYVVRQMTELYHRYGIREFSFEDDTFITFKTRLQDICQQLIELGLDISWTCLGRVNHVTADNLLLMKKAGCWQISFGIESGSQEILSLINKRIRLDQVRQAVRLSREAGIRTKGFFILGHPGETPETLRMTIDFALELPLDDISVCHMTPFPGTELYDRAAEFGEFDPDWNAMNLLTIVFIPHGLTRNELLSAQKELIRRFYFRPRIIIDYGKRLVQNPAMARGLWNGFRSLIRSIRN
jgi:radical SAM superfamily enzyme YgiQ (UPF0313 family)